MGTEAAPQQAESIPRALGSCCRPHGQLRKSTGLVKMLGEKGVNLEACHDCRQYQEGSKENLSSRFHEEGQGSFLSGLLFCLLLKRNATSTMLGQSQAVGVGENGMPGLCTPGSCSFVTGLLINFPCLLRWTAATSPDLPHMKTKLLYRHKPSTLPRCPLVTCTLRPCLHPPIRTLQDLSFQPALVLRLSMKPRASSCLLGLR